MVDKKLKKRGDELGLIGFIFGIISIILVSNNGVLFAILGFIFCYIQQKKNPTKFGKIGIILNIIGFVLAIILIILALTYLKPLLESTLESFPAQ
ncbi:MAG: hypothetical protein KKF48_03710 [Nanoarchaeota archaeon]|nr:hypothetical protein [Nanoarchaeota archaeon]MBU1028124.1 hypothetical protein [Nanoarchaeota archaeon]